MPGKSALGIIGTAAVFFMLASFSQAISFEKPLGYSVQLESAYAFHSNENERFQYGPSFRSGVILSRNHRIDIEAAHLFYDGGTDSVHTGFRYYLLSVSWKMSFNNGEVGLGYTVSPAIRYARDLKDVPGNAASSNSVGYVGVCGFFSTRRELTTLSFAGRIFTTDTKNPSSDFINYFVQARADRIVNKLLTLNCSLDFWEYRDLGSMNDIMQRPYYPSGNMGKYRTSLFLIPSLTVTWKNFSLRGGPVFNIVARSANEEKASLQASIGYGW
jgi:hypothetical protein